VASAGKGPRSPALRGLERQGSRILDGGSATFERYEFPFFQRLARKYRERVAFLGVDSQDNRGDARDFLREFPTPFPHYFDPETKIARSFRG
jgi:hypothetical protein